MVQHDAIKFLRACDFSEEDVQDAIAQMEANPDFELADWLEHPRFKQTTHIMDYLTR